jgi:hypothetical protein
MWVHVAVLKETQGLERRVALVRSVAAGLIKLGARLRRQSQHGLRRCPGRVGEYDRDSQSPEPVCHPRILF